MLDKITLGRYYLKNSVVHKLNPVFKIISLIIMIVGIFFIDSYVDVFMLFMYLFLVMVYSDIDIFIYLKNIYGIKIFLVFILVIDLIFFSGINKIIFDLFRIIFIILYSSVLTYTTAMTEITYGIERILRPFNKFIPVNDIAMVITLTLRYIPTLLVEANRIIRAQKMRGIDFEKGSIKERVICMSGIFVPMFILSLKKAEEAADIMDIRLYNYGKSRTNYRLNKWRRLDTLLFVLNMAILTIVILY